MARLVALRSCGSDSTQKRHGYAGGSHGERHSKGSGEGAWASLATGGGRDGVLLPRMPQEPQCDRPWKKTDDFIRDGNALFFPKLRLLPAMRNLLLSRRRSTGAEQKRCSKKGRSLNAGTGSAAERFSGSISEGKPSRDDPWSPGATTSQPGKASTHSSNNSMRRLFFAEWPRRKPCWLWPTEPFGSGTWWTTGSRRPRAALTSGMSGNIYGRLPAPPSEKTIPRPNSGRHRLPAEKSAVW